MGHYECHALYVGGEREPESHAWPSTDCRLPADHPGFPNLILTGLDQKWA